MTVQPHMITFSKEERQRADELEDYRYNLKVLLQQSNLSRRLFLWPKFEM